ncbi:MAG: hypothetical protein HY609_05910 [Deltaproteobacteria bacterium]|nr:hypothetical protein [Deltaproteobacteria bacterium]
MEKRKWYVIQSKPQKERLVCAQLRSAPIEVDVFFPRLRNHTGVRPLFPSYLFVNMAMNNVANYKFIKYTRGVLRLVGTREGPIPVLPDVVETIQSRMGPHDMLDQRYVMPMGRAVRVRKGPLKDLIGILEKPVSEEGRVQILFRLLRYPLRAVLKFEELEVI